MAEELIGTIERITFYNPESGFCVLKLDSDSDTPQEAHDREGLVSVVGVMPELIDGERARFIGKWVENPTYGRQFKAEMTFPMPLQHKEGVVRYLKDNVHGVGEKIAERIYDHFGADTISILDRNPSRIQEVPNLPHNVRDSIIETFSTDRAKRQILVFLQGLGMTANLAMRIFETYNTSVVHILTQDPYQLADDLRGIGFKKADMIAQKLGIEPHSDKRIRAGLSYALSQLSQEGHVFAPRELLIQTTCQLLGIPDYQSLAQEVLDNQIRLRELVAETVLDEQGNSIDAVYLSPFHRNEEDVAIRLQRIAKVPSKFAGNVAQTNLKHLLQNITNMNDVHLSAQQEDAVISALLSKISILTGGPGTGKTTTLKMLILALEILEIDYLLATPTGRASKRLSEATERPAVTIHRLLEFTPELWGFNRNEENPLQTQFLILDETSMLDLWLFSKVLSALPSDAHLLLVGDVDQLPSVGAGNVLKDVINSGIAHVTRLKTIFRQESNSYIINNAHRINSGEMPNMDNQSDDFYFFNAPSPDETLRLVLDIVKNRLPNKFGFNPVLDVQVIAPMYRGGAGVDALNSALQEALNNNFRLAKLKIGTRLLRVGDKVMQTKNNYAKEVFNGDIGFVRLINETTRTAVLLIDGKPVDYDYEELEEQIIHAYCISTHRSQGSEYPVVVMPLLRQHYMMLQRNLLYTAVTRAKKMVVLVGDKQAVWMAVNNNKVSERYSALVYRLGLEYPQEKPENPLMSLSPEELEELINDTKNRFPSLFDYEDDFEEPS